MSQKWIGGLWVNGAPPSVGRKNAPVARISRMTWAYLVSSPTKRSRRNGVMRVESATRQTAASARRRESGMRQEKRAGGAHFANDLGVLGLVADEEVAPERGDESRERHEANGGLGEAAGKRHAAGERV